MSAITHWDRFQLILSQLPLSSFCLCFGNSPPSPPLSAQDGDELENLMGGARDGGDDGWDNELEDDAVMLRTPRVAKERKMKSSISHMKAGPSTRGNQEPPSYNTRVSLLRSQSRQSEGGLSSIAGSADEMRKDLDDDATPLDQSTLANLPTLAKRYEPDLTLADIEREEAEQAERDREAEIALSASAKRRVREEDEFGDYARAQQGQEGVAEASFGLGEAEDEDGEH
ncbi:hypothetical protein CI109_100335 [Kwoniella shandongensis]|uniref:Uncharacterized protein n=1 Tax=Kwoniella shandongensis TaxID=1734106 RepID=A0A5M6C9L0_9TREE|nr:uncharacterized protein CI109_001819 [Kwoniella shandongensis]KAA5529879.1 hypothetical protein CI109_001819 [Kwoniella shandongensis]